MATLTTRIMAGLIVVASLLAVGMAVRPQWLTGLRPEARAARAMQLVTQPDERSYVIARRIRAKTDVVARLLEGELTLVEAASHFYHHNAHPPGVQDVAWRSMPGADDGERLCRQVIAWTQAELERNRGTAETTVWTTRLERELADHIAAHGGVPLDER